jgi:hypothetical protein
MRALSDKFMQDLLLEDGMLYPVLDCVRKDQTLMLAIRENYVNIYYRGGNILRISEKTNDSYKAEFNSEYDKFKQGLPDSPPVISIKEDAGEWINSFLYRKGVMDEYFSNHEKTEREFQQVIARENNQSVISNESEYFITDIEFADSALKARFDMTSICWPAATRKTGNNCHVALIEMKYGDNAIDGNSGLIKHLEDMTVLISDKDRYAQLMSMVESQFNQLDQLGLLNFNKGTSKAKVKLDPADKPEVIFILANHNPRSSKLKDILDDPKMKKFKDSQLFDLRFFAASYSGYGMHIRNMLPLSEFRKLL